MSATRIYCDGVLSPGRRKKLMQDQLDKGMVCTGYVVGGQGGILTGKKNDVAYFRDGTPDEIATCRAKMAAPLPPSALEESSE
jgi:hypothetical protein